MSKQKRNRLDELKIKASLLCKGLHSTDIPAQQKAATRFLQLPFLRHSTVEKVLDDISFFRLKHALNVVAIENGSNNWNDLRTKVIMEDCFFHNASSAFLNHWFNNYEEAGIYRQASGGYLVSYRKDFVVCSKEFITSIGLGTLDREWEAIQYDFVKPVDTNAWQVIFNKAREAYLSKEVIPPKVTDKTKRPSRGAQ